MVRCVPERADRVLAELAQQLDPPVLTDGGAPPVTTPHGPCQPMDVCCRTKGLGCLHEKRLIDLRLGREVRHEETGALSDAPRSRAGPGPPRDRGRGPGSAGHGDRHGPARIARLHGRRLRERGADAVGVRAGDGHRPARTAAGPLRDRDPRRGGRPIVRTGPRRIGRGSAPVRTSRSSRGSRRPESRSSTCSRTHWPPSRRGGRD